MIEFDVQMLAGQIRNLVRMGNIVEIDFTQGKVKIQYEKDFISDWIPWSESQANTTQTWTPPKIGTQAIVLNANGNLKRGVIIGYINQNKYPQMAQALKCMRLTTQ